MGSNQLPDGVTLQTHAHCQIVIIENLSAELKEHIREFITAVCHGSAIVETVPLWNYLNTMKELNARLQAKDRNGRVGMIGELLTHIFAPYLLPHLVSSAIYFNKEERNVKKGFDLTFFDEAKGDVWYAEVKSGSPSQGEMATSKAVGLLKKAASDLIEKLTSTDRMSLWNSAIFDASVALKDPALTSVKHILSNHASLAAEGKTWDFHAILTAGVFAHSVDNRISIDSVTKKIDFTSKLEPKFVDEILITIQKSTFEAVVDFIANEAGQ